MELNMVADMEVNKVADMELNMEADMFKTKYTKPELL